MQIVMKSGITGDGSYPIAEQHGHQELVSVRHKNFRRSSQLIGKLSQRAARSTVVLLVLVSAFTSTSSSTWSEDELTCYDDLRQANTLTGDVIYVRTSPDSSVVEVTLRGGKATCDTSPEATDGEEESSDGGGTYRLCGLTSMTGLSHETIYSSELAVMHFNTKNTTIVRDLDRIERCNVRLTMEYFDTENSPIVANTRLVDNVLSREHSLETPQPCSLVGASMSSVSDTLSILSSANNLPAISFMSTSSNLDNKDIYKLFGRTVPTDAGTAIAAVRYLRDILDVTHCAVLHVMDEWGVAFNRAFTQAAIAHGGDPPMQVVSASYIMDENASSIKTAVGQLANSGYNYVFAVIHTDELEPVLEAATDGGIMGPGRSWMFGEMALSEDRGKLLEVHGVTLISLGLEPNRPFEEAWATLESDENLKQYIVSKMPPNLNITLYEKPNEWSYFMYDTVMSIGFAACDAERLFSGPGLFNAFTTTSFTGVSGDVRFDHDTGTRNVSRVLYKISNVVRATEANDTSGPTYRFVKVAQMNYGENSSDGPAQWDLLAPTVYADDSTTPPPVLRVDFNLASTGVLVAGLTLAGIILAVSLAGVVWTVVYRTSRVVQMSQPEFLIMLCIGTMLMACALIPLSLQEPASQQVLDAACMTFPWLFCTGWVVSFSALLSKSLRIRKLFKSASGGRAHQRASDFLLPFILCFGINIILLMAWTIVAPLTWQRREVVTLSSDGIPYIESFGQCESDDGGLEKTFWVLLFVLQVACISFAFYENFRDRRILTEYNESYYIIVSVASIFETYVLALPVFFGVQAWTSHSGFFLLWSIFITAVSGVILIPLFVPKEKARRREAKEARQGSARKSRLEREWELWVQLTTKNESLKKELGSLKSTGALDESYIYYGQITLLLEQSKSSIDGSSESSSMGEGSQVQQPWTPGLDQLCL